MVLATNNKIVETFTLGSKLTAIETQDPSVYQHPVTKDYVDYLNEKRPSMATIPRSNEPYPGLGRPMPKAEPGAKPPYPVLGPSEPQCGSRPVDHSSDKFLGLSLEMATYNSNRTFPRNLHNCMINE